MDDISLLYVEDDQEALEDVVFLLKRYFTNIYTALDGQEGLALFHKHKPDVVLLDINIPKLNGLELASKIKTINEDIPIVFLTAHSDKDKLLKAINIRVMSYIIKPFNIDELKNSILQSINILNKKNISNDLISLENGFFWNKQNHELVFEDEKINLTKNEILLITFLLKNKTIFITSIELCEIIFKNKPIEANSIVQMISRFKRKIRNKINNDKFFIENIYGEGYRIK